MFRTFPLSIIRSFFTLHSAMVYVIHVCRQLLIRMDPDQSSVQWNNSWWWTEELSETCRVSFQNKFEKLLHLAGFSIRICHDARLHERKIHGINLGQKITKHSGLLVWCQQSCKLWNIKITACSIVCVFDWLNDGLIDWLNTVGTNRNFRGASHYQMQECAD